MRRFVPSTRAAAAALGGATSAGPFLVMVLVAVLLLGNQDANGTFAQAQEQQQQQEGEGGVMGSEVVTSGTGGGGGGGGGGALPRSSSLSTSSSSSSLLCTSPDKVYTAKVNLYGSELGNYQFEECGDVNNPTITMEVGETYTFVQKDRSNYMHPFGYAYSAFGDEELKLELEPGISKNTDCDKNLTCPAPMYFLDDEYLGHYSNDPDILPVTDNATDWGLDVYEPLFLRNVHEWSSMGTFSVKLRIDVPIESVNYDLFYFCHVHEWMVGRIKLTHRGQLLNVLESPSLGFEYDVPSEFDQMCGTYGLGPFQLPHPSCPDRFVCGLEEASGELQQFSQCIDAMNCHQLAGMTTGVQAHSEIALFLHQMIPHHQNAVNMAKLTLKANKLKCEDLSNNEDPDCVLEGILRQIVNDQNMQIQIMYDLLHVYNYPEADNCAVHVETTEIVQADEFGDVTVTRIDTESTTTGSSNAVSQFRFRGWPYVAVVGAVAGLLHMHI